LTTHYSLFIMQKILFTAFIFLSICLQSSAQKLGDATERSTKLTEWMRINLSLTDEQLPVVRDINLKYAKRMDELKVNSLSKSEKMKQITDNDKAKDVELKHVLTSSQFQTYLSKKQEIKKKLKENLRQRHQAG